MMKSIKPAPPIASESRLRNIERLARERIASMKQDAPLQGREESATLTLAIQGIEPDVQRGIKVKQGATSGQEATYGSAKEKQEKKNKIRHIYYEVKEAHPDWREKQIVAELVVRLGFSERTVNRYKPLLKE